MPTKIKYQIANENTKKGIVPAGKHERNTYAYEIKKNGSKELVITGKENTYEKIQAELEETKIENILKRVAVGDMSDFRPNGIYQDVTDIPKDLNGAMAEIQKMENIWNTLPKEIKDEYNNDVRQYISDAGSEKWLNLMGYQTEKPKEVKEEAPKLENELETPKE